MRGEEYPLIAINVDDFDVEHLQLQYLYDGS